MTTRQSFSRLLGAAGLVFAVASQTSGALAGTSGGVAGIVTNSQNGTPVAGATIRISSPSQTVTTKTDAKGHFIVFALQPDNYNVTAVKEGYDAHSVTGYEVQADQTQQVDVQLSPSSGTDASGQPPGRGSAIRAIPTHPTRS
jgi:Carboxypeptidase regulatory-like domain